MTKKEPNPLRRRRRIRQLVGVIICLLVVIGIGTIISSGIGVAIKLTDDTAEKEDFARRISNLVPYDPIPFDTLAEANQNVLLAASIWGTLGSIDQTLLERDDIGQPYLPTVDIDRWAASLYGLEFKFTHAGFEEHGLLYTYVEEKQSYLIPITGAMMDYSPEVVKIKKEKNTKRVTVGYISPFTSTGEFNSSSELKPVKYLDYIFTKSDKSYYLSAITESATKVLVASSTAAAVTPDALEPNDFINENASSMPQSATTSTSSAPPAAE